MVMFVIKSVLLYHKDKNVLRNRLCLLMFGAPWIRDGLLADSNQSVEAAACLPPVVDQMGCILFQQPLDPSDRFANTKTYTTTIS